MQIVKTALFQLLIVVVLFLSPFTLPAQDFATEGVSEFSVTYKPKNDKVKARDLTRKYGNREMVYWTETQLKRVSLLNENTLMASYWSYPDTVRYVRYKEDPYFYVRSNTPTKNPYRKTETDVLVNNILCDVYNDSIKNITVYIIKDKPFKFSPVSNFRDLVRWEIERDDYTIVKERTTRGNYFNKVSEFNIDKDKIVFPYTNCTNCNSHDFALSQFSKAFNERLKFPRYLLFKNLEGKSRLSFIIDKEGNPVNPVLTPEYFRSYRSIKKVTSQRKIERITRRIERRILKNFHESMESIEFEPPMADDEPINIRMSVPVGYFYYSR